MFSSGFTESGRGCHNSNVSQMLHFTMGLGFLKTRLLLFFNIFYLGLAGKSEWREWGRSSTHNPLVQRRTLTKNYEKRLDYFQRDY